MLGLSHPTSWYFDTCRQILWARLTYDKLYILYSDEVKDELISVWCAALRRATNAGPLVDAEGILIDALQADDVEWRKMVNLVEASLDMADAIDDYFLGDTAKQVITEIEGGGYHEVR